MIIKVVFLGSPEFAVPSLKSLANDPDLNVVQVVTQPDRRAGRGRTLTPPPVKEAALGLDLPVYQPESLRTAAGSEPIVQMSPDLLVVVAYGEILRRHVLEIAGFGAVNVHPSLLPLYRGSSPVRAAILNGDQATGVSIIKLVRRLDAGPILRKEEVSINQSENAATLTKRLAEVAAEILPSTCCAWVNGEILPCDQDESRMTMTREWTRDDARIDWQRSAEHIERLVRASQPWPVAWTTLDGEPFRILESAVSQVEPRSVGVVSRAHKQIVVGTGNRALQLVSIQPAGKRIMSATDWWNGLRTDFAQFDG